MKNSFFSSNIHNPHLVLVVNPKKIIFSLVFTSDIKSPRSFREKIFFGSLWALYKDGIARVRYIFQKFVGAAFGS